MNTDVMFSSKTDMWSTPQDFFDKINKEFNCQTDVCATPDNAKCSKFFTPEQNGLLQEWTGTCWLNPPYGREIKQWVEKAYHSHLKGAVIIALLPARTDTQWFHKFIYNKAEIRFIKGRLKFGDAVNSAPFPSMLVIWKK